MSVGTAGNLPTSCLTLPCLCPKPGRKRPASTMEMKMPPGCRECIPAALRLVGIEHVGPAALSGNECGVRCHRKVVAAEIDDASQQ